MTRNWNWKGLKYLTNMYISTNYSDQYGDVKRYHCSKWFISPAALAQIDDFAKSFATYQAHYCYYDGRENRRVRKCGKLGEKVKRLGLTGI